MSDIKNNKARTKEAFIQKYKDGYVNELALLLNSSSKLCQALSKAYERALDAIDDPIEIAEFDLDKIGKKFVILVGAKPISFRAEGHHCQLELTRWGENAKGQNKGYVIILHCVGIEALDELNNKKRKLVLIIDTQQENIFARPCLLHLDNNNYVDSTEPLQDKTWADAIQKAGGRITSCLNDGSISLTFGSKKRIIREARSCFEL